MPRFDYHELTAEDGSKVTVGVPSGFDPENPFGSYTEEQVSAAFDSVKDPEHWKGRIDKFVGLDPESAEDELALIDFAVRFYTATEASHKLVEIKDGRHIYRVRAPGYWMGPAN